jgi:hypothetical protein
MRILQLGMPRELTASEGERDRRYSDTTPAPDRSWAKDGLGGLAKSCATNVNGTRSKSGNQP